MQISGLQVQDTCEAQDGVKRELARLLHLNLAVIFGIIFMKAYLFRVIDVLLIILIYVRLLFQLECFPFKLKMMLVDIIKQIASLEFQVEEEQNFGPTFRRLFQEIQDLRGHRNKVQEARRDLLEYFIDSTCSIWTIGILEEVTSVVTGALHFI